MNQPETTPDFDDENEMPSQSVGQHVQSLLSQLGEALGLSDEEELEIDEASDDEGDEDFEDDSEDGAY